jgi:Uma2 family endonuclease
VTQIHPPLAGSRALSLEEWAALPEDEPGEFVDGRLEEEEVPDNEHETIVVYLASLLRSWAVPRGGFVLGSEAKFRVRANRGRKPDMTVYLPGGHRPPRRGVNRVAPDIAMEVISRRPRDARRDRIDKADEYASFGVRWYWLVDPQARSLEIWELDPQGRYARVAAAGEGRIDPVPGCPELALDLDQLWAELDRLGPDEPEQ